MQYYTHNAQGMGGLTMKFDVKFAVLNLGLLLASIAMAYLFGFIVSSLYEKVFTFERAVGSTLMMAIPVFSLLRTKVKEKVVVNKKEALSGVK